MAEPSRLVDARALARGHTETCINVLVDILTDVDAPIAARKKAAKVLSNYIWAPEVRRTGQGSTRCDFRN